jgi:exopolyphosphatase/guanosine-5'-triphosphate,3'-diphosphate pyrophosphatase
MPATPKSASGTPATSSPREILKNVRAFGRACQYEAAHARNVTHLALSLFAELADVHGLGVEGRRVLQCAGLLHDIGFPAGKQAHHKRAMEMILKARDLGLSPREQLMVANVARYHRKALPTARHPAYRRLERADRQAVAMLGGLLRLADGLDRRHVGCVRGVRCYMTNSGLVVECHATAPAGPEVRAARGKSDLLAKLLGRPIRIYCPA